MATATKKLPTSAQMKAYAEKLPEIYRAVFRSMYQTDPDRTIGETISFGLLQSRLEPNYPTRIIYACIIELETNGYLTLDERIGMIELTDLGEELLAVITGKRPREETIPKLPKPTW